MKHAIILFVLLLVGQGLLFAQGPRITSFSPATAPAQAYITIDGTNLSTVAVVRFSDVAATDFTVDSPTKITCVVPSGAASGKISVYSAVGNDTSGGTFTVMQSKLAQVPRVPGAYCFRLAVSDYTHDGHSDCVSLIHDSVSSENRCVLFPGQGDGTFGSPTAVTLSHSLGSPVGICTGDLDQDGRLDIVCAAGHGGGGSGGAIYLFRSSPTSPSGVTHTVTWDSPRDLGGVAIGSAASDGSPFVVFAQQPDGGQASRLLSTSNCGSNAPSLTASIVGPVIHSLMIPSGSSLTWSERKICVATGDGIHVFQHNQTDLDFIRIALLGSGNSYDQVAVGDVDGDGLEDIVALNRGSGTISTFRCVTQNPLAFSSSIDITLSSSPVCIAVGDLDGDGVAEIAIDEQGVHRSLSYYRTTSPPGILPITFARVDMDDCDDGDAQALAIGDLDGDGTLDVAVGGCSSTSKVLPKITSFTPASGPARTMVQVNGENLDAFTHLYYGDDAMALKDSVLVPRLRVGTVPVAAASGRCFTIQTPDGFASSTDTFHITPNLAVAPPNADPTQTIWVGAGDVNGDGYPDVVSVVQYLDSKGVIHRDLAARMVNGGGILLPQVSVTSTACRALSLSDPCPVAIGDLDGDGRADIVIQARDQFGNAGSSRLMVLVADSSHPGSFFTRFTWTQTGGPFKLVTGDVNGDGMPDIVCCVRGSVDDSAFVLTNNPLDRGAFTPHPGWSLGHVSDCCVRRRPGTSVYDLVVSTDNGLYLYENDGSAHFTVNPGFPYAPDPNRYVHVAAGDLDGDGISELVCVERDSGYINVYSGGALGDLSQRRLAGRLQIEHERFGGISLADLDGDGRMDLVIDGTSSSYPGFVTACRSIASGDSLLLESYEIHTSDCDDNDPKRVAVGDLNGDSYPDIIVGGCSASVDHPPFISRLSSNACVPGQVLSIAGSNFGGTSSIMFGSLDAASYKLQSGFIYATAPSGAQRSRLIVRCPDGTCAMADELPVLGLPNSSSVRTFVVPHILEKSGKISNTPNTFDTQFFMTYSGGRLGTPPGGGAAVDLYLYNDSTGAPLRGSSGEVCNPCRFGLSAAHPDSEVTIDDLITANGGGFDDQVKTSFAVLLVGGSDPDKVHIECKTTNALSSSSDVSSWSCPVIERSADADTGGGSAGTQRRAFVVPHILEKSGRISNTPFTFDTDIYATLESGLLHFPNDTGETVELYLYNDDGSVMTGNGGTPVCNPCQSSLTQNTRQRVIDLESRLQAAGLLDNAQAVKLGFGVVVVSGSDPDGVCLQGFVVNSHTSPFDLSVFGFDPQPITAASTVAQPGARKGEQVQSARSYVIPHVLETSGKISSAPYTFDTEIHMVDAAGLAGTPPDADQTVHLYLYDSATSQAMKGANGQDVCNPCTYTLGASNRKVSVRIDDLITSNGGGFDAPRKNGLAVLEGIDDRNLLGLKAFVVNSHSGPFDLSFAESGLQPLAGTSNPSPDPSPKAFVLPHVLEKSGTISNTQFTFDTEIDAVYGGGGGGGGAAGAMVSLYLYDQSTGQPMQSATSDDVCNPCNFPLGVARRKQSIRIDDLITAKGGFASSEQKGSACIVVGGDKDNVALSSFVVNSHSSPFDLSVFGFDPQPIVAPAFSVPVPVITIEPAIIDFGSLRVKDSATQTITLRNVSSSADVVVSSLSCDDPDFHLSGPPFPIIIPAAGTATETVVFRPHRGEVKRTTAHVESNGGGVDIEISAIGLDTVKYRTFSLDSILTSVDAKGVAGNPIKRKADKVQFQFTLIAPPTATTLDCKLDQVASGRVERKSVSVILFNDSKIWSVPTVAAGETVIVSGYGTKGKPIKASLVWGTTPKLTKAKVTAFDLNQARFPMPNRINTFTELFELGGFSSGLVVGIPRLDSAKYYGWLNAKKSKDVLKSFFEKGDTPTGEERGFDVTSAGKPITKAQASLAISKFDNVLLSDAITLKINIAASAMGLTQPGFGELIYDDGSPDNLLNGRMVRDIASYCDSLMMGVYDPVSKAKLFADPSLFTDLESTISSINEAFEGPLDTASFGASLVWTDVRPVQDCPFLHTNPGAIPARITPLANRRVETPARFALNQNYPNPFNPATMISFSVRQPSFVTLNVYNILGQQVATLIDKQLFDEGDQAVSFDASRLASGVYFYRLIAEGIANQDDALAAQTFTSVRKMMLVK